VVAELRVVGFAFVPADASRRLLAWQATDPMFVPAGHFASLERPPGAAGAGAKAIAPVAPVASHFPGEIGRA
jgi:hypothetical protein